MLIAKNVLVNSCLICSFVKKIIERWKQLPEY
jgi:hypothetical protein